MSNDPFQTDENRLVRDDHGRFLKGCPPGPGRPKGSIDFMATCRQRAEAEGIDLEDMVWAVAKSLFESAAKGDTAAAKIILDRTCGPVRKEPPVAVQVAQTTPCGPPVPEGREFVDYFRGLAELADNLEIQYLFGAKFLSPESIANESETDTLP